MPRVPPMYRFMQMHFQDLRKACIDTSDDSSWRDALDLWENLTSSDRTRVKERLLLMDQGELSEEALSYYNEIKTSSNGLLRRIATDAVRSEAQKVVEKPEKPLFFLFVLESPMLIGYAGELTIIRFSLANGVESYVHAQLDSNSFDGKLISPALRRSKPVSHFIPIRDDPDEFQNLKDLATGVRGFVGENKLFTPRMEMRPSNATIQLLNRVDVKFERDALEVFEAEELLNTMVNGRAVDLDLYSMLKQPTRLKQENLACDAHGARGSTDRCTLLNSLLMSQDFGEIFAVCHNYDGRKYVLKSRPFGHLFSGSTNRPELSPPRAKIPKSDAVFRKPKSRSTKHDRPAGIITTGIDASSHMTITPDL